MWSPNRKSDLALKDHLKEHNNQQEGRMGPEIALGPVRIPRTLRGNPI